MKYLNPLLWYNKSNPKYDFDTDTHLDAFKNGRERAEFKQRPYEYFKGPLSDGLLVSRTLLESIAAVKKVKGRYMVIPYYKPEGFKTCREFINYWRPNIMFADPGTWTYAHYLELPDYLYDTEDLIDYYNDLGFDIAGSVDWPIIDKIRLVTSTGRKFMTLDTKTKEMRMNLTLDNAQKFIDACDARPDINFVPFGTIQGYSIETYKYSLQQILKMNYKYIAIGGLPSYSEQQVLALLPMIAREIKKSGKQVGMHLYGRFPSPSATAAFLKAGVTSFDNNTSFIFASGKSSCVYIDPKFKTEGESTLNGCYGIKIPSGRMGRNRMINKYKANATETEGRIIEDICENAFTLFCQYSRNRNSATLRKFLVLYRKINEILNVTRSTPYSTRKLDQTISDCKKVLSKRAWENCGCSSCEELRAHIVLTRGAERSYHTFAHNTHVQYVRLLLELNKAKEVVDYPQYNWSPINKIVRSKLRR